MEFENLPPDLIRKIALDLKPYDFVRLCSSKRLYKEICQDEKFWRLKIERDYPEIFNFFKKSGIFLKDPKKTYIRTFTKISESIENSIESVKDQKDLYKRFYSAFEDIKKDVDVKKLKEIFYLGDDRDFNINPYLEKYNITDVKHFKTAFGQSYPIWKYVL